MQVRLEVARDKANVRKVVLRSNALIGRSAECNLRIASSEVSRKHCQLLVDDERVAVQDLGSSNGTFVNGRKIAPHTDVALLPGTRLSVGGVEFVVQFDAPAGMVVDPGSTIDMVPDETVPADGRDSGEAMAPPSNGRAADGGIQTAGSFPFAESNADFDPDFEEACDADEADTEGPFTFADPAAATAMKDDEDEELPPTGDELEEERPPEAPRQKPGRLRSLFSRFRPGSAAEGPAPAVNESSPAVNDEEPEEANEVSETEGSTAEDPPFSAPEFEDEPEQEPALEAATDDDADEPEDDDLNQFLGQLNSR